MKNNDNMFECVNCTLKGNKDFVMDIVQFLCARLKFNNDEFALVANNNDNITAKFKINGFFVDERGEYKTVKGAIAAIPLD